MKMLPTQLPSWMGVPVPGNHAFREADVEWQLRLIHFLKQNEIPFSDVAPYSIERFVRGFSGNRREKALACERYLDFLNSCGIESAMQKTDYSENVILQFISERFLANKR